ncbi:MAG TPA: hypothetical protein VGQ57_00940 [Polyangiaceae bacterium]|jgi:TolA-binding protein|nr:hypothetical protein [Polyangiaceae bacterium]
MNDDIEPEPFTDALREDLPSAADEARVRLRLASAGILAGVGVVAPGAAASGAVVSSTSATGMVAKFLALPLAVKVSASVAVVALAATPFVAASGSGESARRSNAPAKPALVSTARGTAAATAPAATAVGLPSAPAGALPETTAGSELTASLEAKAASAAEVRPVASHARIAALPALAPPRSTQSGLPSTGSFPVGAPEVVDEGTLRAETALVEQALAAMKRGDLATARRELATHAQKFPNGHLAPERERALARMREKETHR